MEKGYKKFTPKQKVTFIKVKTSFEGVHKYPQAPEEVKHLRQEHRHTFVVTVQIEVKHLDRELEFFMVKDYIDRLHKEGIIDFNFMSCEMINDELYNTLVNKYGSDRFYIIETSEDGQRSAISYYNGEEE